ncbi:hypothetical protein [Schaalia turicensis]|uniref:hypothetical protein n=1 Tax=Schaalia turicensis TaxID=131111 RepID=UPI001897F2C5|nr:hypothetical protein [Schaalia turicensis]
MSVYSHRQAEYVVRLLDSQDQEIRVLDGVTGGAVTVSSATRLKASASLQITRTTEEIDWLSQRVRIDYKPTGTQGWPLGVFLLTSPTDSYSETGVSWDVELLSKLAILDESKTETTFSVSAGANLVDTVASLISVQAKADARQVAITASSATALSAMTWDPGTPYLTIINDLLDAAGYWSLWCDGYGIFHVEPYVRPAQRPTVFDFIEGEESIHSASWSRDQDLAEVPNKVVLVGQGSDETPALVGVATNEDPNNPLSYTSRGRWIVYTEEGVEAADQTTLTKKARQVLIDKSTPSASLQIEHLPLDLQTNQAVSFVSQGHQARCVIQKIEYQLSPVALVKTTLREVVDL